MAVSIWLTGTCVTFADLGLPLTVSRFIPALSALRQEQEAAAFGRFFFRPLLMSAALVSVIFLALALFGAQWLRQTAGLHFFEGTNDSIWFAIAAVFAAQAVGNYGLAQLRGEQRFVDAARLSSLFLLVQLIGMAVGSVLNGAEGALFGYASGSFATFGTAWTLLRGDRTLDAALKARAWRFSLGAWWVGIVAAIVWSRTEIAFLDYWRGPAQTGHYAVALTLAQLASQAPLLMTGGLLSFFTERYALADRAGLRRAFLASTRFFGFVLLPTCFGMAAITPVMLP
ncbi:MAG: hypothetical protein HYS06_11925, partial [Methylocystis sp.]|nr:hypothetical protein [Methylocystis sp.]